MTTTSNDDDVESSGNVFADLDLPNAGETLAKAELVRAIGLVITRRGLTQAQAAEQLVIDQPKVSALMRGRLSGYSIDRLLRLLLALDLDIEIVVKAGAPPGGRVSVVALS